MDKNQKSMVGLIKNADFNGKEYKERFKTLTPEYNVNVRTETAKI